MALFIKQLTIIGVGLIGGSLARALKDRDMVGEVVGVNRTRRSLDTALELGVIDRATNDVVEGVKGSTMVLVATPVRSIPKVIEDSISGLSPGTVITDAGSVKGALVDKCEAILQPHDVHFVGSHPVAGTEHSGVASSFSTLFEGSRTVITPTKNTPSDALQQVRLVWEAAGSIVEIMDPHHHDRVLAATSHLPHLMAYNIVNTLSDLEDDIRAEVFRYASGGFRDFTRIASSDPTMWRDICLENRGAILDMLNRFRKDLDKLSVQIETGNEDALYGIFARSKHTRERVLEERKK
ncbi:MAG: prephenate dehydrogenase/arogenate dehydrogenase family protein [Magnetococcales bacterium]|nr:prephenate dehydrogenase/arogenate dehydrogenase family protein [Magnetococcales bacterium]